MEFRIKIRKMLIMRQNFLSVLFLITSQLAFSQSWNPFPKNQNSYFKQQNETSIKVESFLMDSTKSIGNLQLLYFNAKSELEDVCNFNLRQTANKMYWAKNSNKIDSLLMTGDSLLFISSFDSKLDTFIFKPFCKLNESWVINGITIRCTEVGMMDIFGEPDSIKTFKCSGTGFDSVEFILSKSYGFTKFLPFSAFHYYSILYYQQPQYFELIGYSKNSISKGYVQPDFNDYFHLNAGDILYWCDYSDPWDIQQRGYTKYHIDTIKYSYLSSDSVFYQFRQTNFDEKGVFEFTNNYSKFHLRKNEGKIVSNQTSWVGTKFSTDPISDIFFLGSLELKIENEDTITFVNYGFDGFSLDISTCDVRMGFDMSLSVGFSTRAGQIFQGSYSWGEYSSTLIGSIINGVKHGITDIPTGINTLHGPELKIYPNPVKKYLTIDYQGRSIERIEIYDIVGNLMLTEKLKEQIDLSALTPGVYFLKILDASKAIRQIKIMKQ
ncbi:MAG: T9SS type A sorting domain-containing protein [Bacteroidota bacterium]|nr:T9SS type A sorting domain-containing protein [Bacteroidota bacterium]